MRPRRQMLPHLAALGLILQASILVALDNGLAKRPPMGWSSRIRFDCETNCAESQGCISSKLVKEVADKLRLDGYRELGYDHLSLGDCWSAKQRDPNTDRLMSDSERFPEGVAALVEHLHSINFKFGVSGICDGYTDCMFPGHLREEMFIVDRENTYYDSDAETLMKDWQLDAYSLDASYHGIIQMNFIESKCSEPMLRAIQSSRPERAALIQCKWPYQLASNFGRYKAPQYINNEYFDPHRVTQACNTWMLTESIEDSWLSILSTVDIVAQLQDEILKHHGPGQWFDPGELVIGNFGLSYEQARAQMALWSIWSSPLVMGNDPRSLSSDPASQATQILKNHHLIELDQDPLGILGLMVAESVDGLEQAFVKPVMPLGKNGCPSFVILYLNRATLGNRRLIKFDLRDILSKAPIELAANRYKELRQASGSQQAFTQDFEANSCRRFLEKAMTRKPGLIPADLLIHAGQSQKSEPLVEVQVHFQMTDLLTGHQMPMQVALDSDLELGVNPSGVAVVKLY